MYIGTQYLSKRLECSYEDKKECIETINQIWGLVDIVQRGSYNNLEREVKRNNSYCPLLKKGIQLVIDRTLSDDEIKTIMYTYIAAGNYKGKEFLKNIIILEGVVCLNSLMNGFGRIISDMMYSYLGTEFYTDTGNNIALTSQLLKNKE